MKLSTLLKACGCAYAQILDNQGEEFKELAVLDYTIGITGHEGVYYSSRVSLPTELKARKVDFFTESKFYNHQHKYVAGIRIYVK